MQKLVRDGFFFSESHFEEIPDAQTEKVSLGESLAGRVLKEIIVVVEKNA